MAASYSACWWRSGQPCFVDGAAELNGREFAESTHLAAVQYLVLEFVGSPFRERLAFVMSFDVGKAPYLL
jgi:hypothetical protein